MRFQKKTLLLKIFMFTCQNGRSENLKRRKLFKILPLFIYPGAIIDVCVFTTLYVHTQTRVGPTDYGFSIRKFNALGFIGDNSWKNSDRKYLQIQYIKLLTTQ